MPEGSGGEAMGRDDLIAGFLLAASLGLAVGFQLLVPAGRAPTVCPLHPSIHPDCNGWQGEPAHAPASPW